MTDGELLAEFARARSETAFSELLRRHGAMVHGVCLRVTGRPEWAEEASQAAFLVLARKASAVSARPEIGGWLQRVAADLARDLLRSEARRRNRQEEAAQIRGSERSQTEAQDVALLRGLVDLELAALSEKQRQAIVGLYLEGHTRAELAKVLGIPEGTLAWRAKTALEKLRQRLTRRGVAPSAVPLAALLSDLPTLAQLPEVFTALPSRALQFAAPGAAGAPGFGAWTLAEGAVRAMYWMKMKALAALIMLLAAVGGGGSAVWRLAAGEGQAAARPAAGQTVRVLLIAGAPGAAYQQLAYALLRDRNCRLSCYLQSADVNAVQLGHDPVEELPRTQAEWEKYDTVVLCDIDPNKLNNDQEGQLEQLIAGGGGLVTLAGKVHGLAALLQVRGEKLRSLLPVEIDPGLPPRYDEYHSEPFHLARTAQGQRHPLLILSPDQKANEEVWQALSGIGHFWRQSVVGLKREAVPLLAVQGPGAVPAAQDCVLALARHGKGGSLYLGFRADALGRIRPVLPADGADGGGGQACAASRPAGRGGSSIGRRECCLWRAGGADGGGEHRLPFGQAGRDGASSGLGPPPDHAGCREADPASVAAGEGWAASGRELGRQVVSEELRSDGAVLHGAPCRG